MEAEGPTTRTRESVFLPGKTYFKEKWLWEWAAYERSEKQ